jgi:hypothetical protein
MAKQMEQFKKWWKNYECDLPITCGNLTCHNCKMIRGETWEAVLEWMLTLKFKYNPKYNDNTEVILAEHIKKELNDERV